MDQQLKEVREARDKEWKQKRQIETDEALARSLEESEYQGGSNTKRPRGCTRDPLYSPSATFQLLRTRDLPDHLNEGCVTINDVIKGNVLWGIISNYMIDSEWMLSQCPAMRNIQKLVIMYGDSGEKLQHFQLLSSGSCEVHKPPLQPFGTHHTKAFFLVYPEGVRVVVHTANLIRIDWDNKTQGLWMQDFPLKQGGTGPASTFENELVEYLAELHWSGTQVPAVGGGTELANAQYFRRFDYSRATVRLIGSVPGTHMGRNLTKWGHLKMRAILRHEAFPQDFEMTPLVFQFTSIGSLEEKWLDEICASMCEGYGENTNPPRRLGQLAVRLIWPTVENVRESLEGYVGGASIPGATKNVDKLFLLNHWASWTSEKSGRSRALPHIKSYLRHNEQRLAWFLLTSANLSKAAWGVLQKQNTQLFIRSYELGVLFLPSLLAQHYQHIFSLTEPLPVSPSGSSAMPSPTATTPRQPYVHLVTTAIDQQNDSGLVSPSEPGERPLQLGDPHGEASHSGEPSGEPMQTGYFSEEPLQRGAASQPGGSSGEPLQPGQSSGAPSQPGESSAGPSQPSDRSGPHLQIVGNRPEEAIDDGRMHIIVKLPVPYTIPPPKYKPGDEPWTIDKIYLNQDSQGEVWPRGFDKYSG